MRILGDAHEEIAARARSVRPLSRSAAQSRAQEAWTRCRHPPLGGGLATRDATALLRDRLGPGLPPRRPRAPDPSPRSSICQARSGSSAPGGNQERVTYAPAGWCSSRPAALSLSSVQEVRILLFAKTIRRRSLRRGKHAIALRSHSVFPRRPVASSEGGRRAAIRGRTSSGDLPSARRRAREGKKADRCSWRGRPDITWSTGSASGFMGFRLRSLGSVLKRLGLRCQRFGPGRLELASFLFRQSSAGTADPRTQLRVSTSRPAPGALRNGGFSSAPNAGTGASRAPRCAEPSTGSVALLHLSHSFAE
jgi:hypothetical protein